MNSIAHQIYPYICKHSTLTATVAAQDAPQQADTKHTVILPIIGV